MTDTAPKLARFHAMTDGTKEDWRIIGEASIHNFVGLPERLMAHLELLGGDFGGFAVDRLTHSLQTATRAERAGRDDEYVLCALVHDIGDTLGPANHADIAAAILKPFVSEQNHWMVEQHGTFQGYYFFHHLGGNRDERSSSGITRGSTTAPSSARSTTRTRSTPITRPNRSSTSSR